MKIKSVISAFVAALLPVTSVFSANVDEATVKFTDTGYGFIVSGKLDSVAKELVIKIMDTGDSDTTADAQMKVFTVLDLEGKTEFSQTFNLLDEPDSGRYYVYFSGAGVTAPQKPLEIWYQNENDRQNLVDSIYDSAAEPAHKSALFDDTDVYLDGELYDTADLLMLKNDLYKDSYDADVSKIIYQQKTRDYGTLKNNFNIATAIAAFEANEFNIWINSDSKMITKIWADDDLLMGNTQMHYNDTLSIKGRNNVIGLLSNKEYQNAQEFNKAFARAVLYNGIYSPAVDGFGHYEELIAQTASACDYDFSQYLSLSDDEKSTVGSLLLQAKAQNFELMCEALSNIISQVKNPVINENISSGTGNGGGGGNINPVISGGQQSGFIPGVAINPEDNSVFSDIKSVEWAKDAIEYLKDKGVVSGTGDGKFEPDRAVKREEFIKMLITALEIVPDDTLQTFTDVDINSWYAPFVSKALELEITAGMGDGSFGVGKPITREQCCAFIFRACYDRDFSGEEKNFTDGALVSAFAKESVKALSRAGIIVGDENGNFRPLDNVTRAQTAVMIYRLISGGEAK